MDLAIASDLSASADLRPGPADLAGADLTIGGCAMSFAGCAGAYTDATNDELLRRVIGKTSMDVFAPKCLRIKLGQAIQFTNETPQHFLTGAPCDPDRALDPPSNMTTVMRTFTSLGVYGFYCSSHGTASGTGMAGAILVEP